MTFGRLAAARVRRATVVALLTGMLQACGGGGGDASTGTGTAPPTTPPSGSNSAPGISGSPSTSVPATQAYTFTPAATDADGDSLTFSIANKPSWATFNAATGGLSGTPPTAGTFANIIITVSDGKTSTSLAPFTLNVTAAPTSPALGSARLSWTPPTGRSDGSTLSNLAGYKIRYGTSADNYTQLVSINGAGITSYTVENLDKGTYYFVVTAVDASGVESNFSNAVSKSIS